jgi:predicted dehydrogenase
MLRVSEETGMPIWVAYYRRTLPAFLKAKELIKAGESGKPLMVKIKLYKQAEERNQTTENMNWRVTPEIGGGGHFFDLASHQFDYLDFIFGEISGMKGNASNLGGLYAAEDTVSATWVHESGVKGSGSWSFIADGDSEADEIEIIGEKGKITLSCFASPGLLKVATKKGVTEEILENPKHISQNLVKQVVDELRGVGTCVSTGKSGARTSRVLENMVKDYYSNETS